MIVKKERRKSVDCFIEPNSARRSAAAAITQVIHFIKHTTHSSSPLTADFLCRLRVHLQSSLKSNDFDTITHWSGKGVLVGDHLIHFYLPNFVRKINTQNESYNLDIIPHWSRKKREEGWWKLNSLLYTKFCYKNHDQNESLAIKKQHHKRDDVDKKRSLS